MTASVARLVATTSGGGTRIARAYAQAPQRWSFGQTADDGWAEVSHQVLGDGAFGGDLSRATIRVGAGASLVVRGVAATPLRGAGESAAVVRLSVEPQGALIYVPGAVVPHAGSAHAASLSISVAPGARLFAATTLVRGRSGMGETGAFTRLRLKTRAESGGELALFEDAELAPEDLAHLGSFGEAGAFVSGVCLGDWTLPAGDWWADPAKNRGLVAVNPLRVAGFSVRGLFRTLGDAQDFLTGAEAKFRSSHAVCMPACSGGSAQVRVY